MSDNEVDAADANGTLLALAADRFLLPGDRRFTLPDVAHLCGSDTDTFTRLWLALGLPSSPEETAYTDEDVAVMRRFVRGGTTAVTDYTLHEARIISASLNRIAEVLVDELWDQHFASGQTQVDALSELASTADIVRVEQLMLRLLRRHLVSTIYRRLALQDIATRLGASYLAVGFADLAGYSTLTKEMTDAALTGLIVTFESTVYDTVTRMGGRVVKTLGDGVMFSADEPGAGARIALELAALRDLPPLRIGLVWGPVLVREGDYFGPTVNLVSRVVGEAGAGEVVTDAATARLFGNADDFLARPLGTRELKSFGAVELWAVVAPTSRRL